MLMHLPDPADLALAKEPLLCRGIELALAFCSLNAVDMPVVNVRERSQWRFKDACAYYRPVKIEICVARCAAIGVAGRAWSFPGYVVDRTPYGVIQHEIGHHVDRLRGTDKQAYWSDYSRGVRASTGEAPVTGYCANDAEWFAEIFRLFVTNPDLLRILRPKTHARLIQDGFIPVFSDSWERRLCAAPERTKVAAARKVLRSVRS